MQTVPHLPDVLRHMLFCRVCSDNCIYNDNLRYYRYKKTSQSKKIKESCRINFFPAAFSFLIPDFQLYCKDCSDSR